MRISYSMGEDVDIDVVHPPRADVPPCSATDHLLFNKYFMWFSARRAQPNCHSFDPRFFVGMVAICFYWLTVN